MHICIPHTHYIHIHTTMKYSHIKTKTYTTTELTFMSKCTHTHTHTHTYMHAFAHTHYINKLTSVSTCTRGLPRVNEGVLTSFGWTSEPLSASAKLLVACRLICMYMFTYVRIFVRMYVFLYVCMNVCVYVCVYVCTQTYMYACIHEDIKLCNTHKCTHMHICTQTILTGTWHA